MEKLRKEISYVKKYFDTVPIIKSIAFGGGTPNIIDVEEYEKLFAHLRKEGFHFDANIEPSMEVNPEIIDKDYMKSLKKLE